MKKTGRNDPCPCGSGKKFKKCCEATMIGGRYKAARVDATSAPKVATATRLTGLFHSRVAEIATQTTKTIKARLPKAPTENPLLSEEPLEKKGQS